MKKIPTPVFFLRRSRLALSLFTASLLCTLCLGASSSEATARIGRMPKASIAHQRFRAFDGRSFSLESLRGQVVVVDFFATWCGHSRAHLPTVKQIAETESEHGLQVVGLAVEEPDEKVIGFVKDHKIDYLVATVSDPVFASFVESRDVSVPQTLVYGRGGQLAAHFVGHSAKLDAELISVVRRELDKR